VDGVSKREYTVRWKEPFATSRSHSLQRHEAVSSGTQSVSVVTCSRARSFRNGARAFVMSLAGVKPVPDRHELDACGHRAPAACRSPRGPSRQQSRRWLPAGSVAENASPQRQPASPGLPRLQARAVPRTCRAADRRLPAPGAPGQCRQALLPARRRQAANAPPTRPTPSRPSVEGSGTAGPT